MLSGVMQRPFNTTDVLVAGGFTEESALAAIGAAGEPECLSEGISLEKLYEILSEILKKQFCVMQHEAQLYKTAVQSNKSV